MEKKKQNSKLYCEPCKTCNASGDEFRRLVNLTTSGLIVYINTNGKMQTNKKESVILHNVGNKVLKKPDFFTELCHRKTKCFLCNTLIQRVCSLINEVTEIKENEMIGICEHCKRANTTNECKKCDEMIKRFLSNQVNKYEYHQQALKMRLYEVRRILSLIIDKKNICNHKICQAYYDSNAELKILLELIKSPLPTKQRDIEEYFSLMETSQNSVHENIDGNLLLKYSGLVHESLDASSLESRVESFCICKYLRNRNIESTQSVTFLSDADIETPSNILFQEQSKSALKDLTIKPSVKITLDDEKVKIGERTKPINIISKKKKKTYMQDDKENISQNKIMDKKSTGRKNRKSEQDAEYQMMMKLIKAKDKEKKTNEHIAKKEKIFAMPEIKDLPEIKHVDKKVELMPEISESIIECDKGKPLSPNELIHGNHIIPFHEFQNINTCDNEPLIFKIKHDFIPAEKTLIKPIPPTSEKTTTKVLRTKSHSSVNKTYPGVIKYELSNTKFIENGWTKLPSTKIVRMMNIYKMLPANPQFDWFANHEKQQLLFYNTGEKLAEIDENGCGRWYYKNGRVALEYYNSKDLNSGLKYVVYDFDDIVEGRKNKSRKILASFDHLGNGIVYDNIGNARLKYNQSEGIVIDKKLGPPGRWKWHTLNDPPVIKQVYFDSVEESETCFEEVVKQHIHDPDFIKKVVSEGMLAIEFENFVRDKAAKSLQRYKPFEIRMKAVKINDCFAVRIINQANIQLVFRCNQVSFKLNMGMLLVHNEIIDTWTTDIADVATPFDRPVSRSKSINSFLLSNDSILS